MQEGHEAETFQVRQVGIFGEGGTQWGIGVGVSDRLAAVPQMRGEPGILPDGQEPKSTEPPPFSLVPSLRVGPWNLSLLYLRREESRSPAFVKRTTYGAIILAGEEVSAVTIGIATRTWFWPPPGSFSILRFDASSPLTTRVIVWRPQPERELPVSEVLEKKRLR